jgi:SAM-dependent methyltransferase
MFASMIQKEVVNCLYCMNSDYEEIISWYDEDVLDTIHYVKCKKCRLVFMNPRPTKEEMSKYYLKSYYSYHKLDVISKKRRGSIWETTKIILLTKVITFTFRKKNIFEKFFYGLLVLFFNTMAGGTGLPWNKKSGKLLDVGCGDGFFLYIMRQVSDIEVYGVELGVEGVKKAKEYGLDVTHGDIFSCSAPDNSFDVIMMKGVLEHTHNPLRDLGKAYRLLAPGGEIVLGGLPNIDNCYTTIFGTNLELFYDRHHTFISEYTHIVKMLSKEGFRDIRVKFLGVHQFSQSVSRLLQPRKYANTIGYNPFFLLFGGLLDLILNTFGKGGGGLEVRALK